MSAATASMVAAPIASGSSVVFNNGGLRVNMVASPRSARPLAIRAYGAPAGEPGTGKDERVCSLICLVDVRKVLVHA